jgi:hypothetical protein
LLQAGSLQNLGADINRLARIFSSRSIGAACHAGAEKALVGAGDPMMEL